MSVAVNEKAYAADGSGTRTLEMLESARNYNRWIVDLLQPYLGAANAELGAGQGTITELVAETRSVWPFELSAHHRSLMERRFSGHPRVMPCGANLLEHPELAAFDCIYSANVLEHVDDDLSIVRDSARLLRSRGWFVAFVPAGPWLYSRFDRQIGHCRRYGDEDRKRLERVDTDSARLVLREFRYVNALGALGWLLKMRVLGRTAIDPKDVVRVERLMPVIRSLDRLHLRFGQSAVIALQRDS